MQKLAFYQTRRFQIQLYSALSLILVVLIGYYTFSNLTKMFDMRTEISSHDQLHQALSETDKRLDEEVQKHKEENAELNQTIQNELNQVFPQGENHTALTRTFEKFANDINRTKDPFVVSKIQYLTPKELENEIYQILPIKMTIHSSYNNFFKFLEFVENSGTLSDKTRILDIKSIVINFVSPQGAQGNTSGQDEINFNVSLDTYFRPTI